MQVYWNWSWFFLIFMIKLVIFINRFAWIRRIHRYPGTVVFVRVPKDPPTPALGNYSGDMLKLLNGLTIWLTNAMVSTFYGKSHICGKNPIRWIFVPLLSATAAGVTNGSRLVESTGNDPMVSRHCRRPMDARPYAKETWTVGMRRCYGGPSETTTQPNYDSWQRVRGVLGVGGVAGRRPVVTTAGVDFSHLCCRRKDFVTKTCLQIERF